MILQCGMEIVVTKQGHQVEGEIGGGAKFVRIWSLYIVKITHV